MAGKQTRAPRVVVTGGPGGGKTTAVDLFRREIGERLVIVPESATLLFTGGFPRPDIGSAQRPAQLAIFHVQSNLEELQAATYPDRVLLCDRGTIDGAAYWPNGAEDFFAALGTDHARELARYDAVIFFETAAVGGMSIEGGNRYRLESNEEAVAVDRRLRALWSGHRRFYVVPHNPSFLHKISAGLGILENLLAQFDDGLLGE